MGENLSNLPTSGQPASELPAPSSVIRSMQSVKRFCLVACFCVPGMLVSQPQWLKDAIVRAESARVDRAAYELTVCERYAVIIHGKQRATAHVQRATKLLKAGDKWSGVLREWKTNLRRIHNLRGWLMRAGRTVAELEDKHVLEIGKSGIEGIYDETHSVMASFEGISIGDVIAYEYDIEDREWWSGGHEFNFQRQQPVWLAEFSIRIPDGWRIKESGWNLEKVQRAQVEGGIVWTARDLRYRPEEALMPPWSFMDRTLSVTAEPVGDTSGVPYSDWRQVARWVFRTIIASPVISDSITRAVERITSDARTLQDKVRSVGEYVRDDIRYVAIEIGKGRWVPRPAEQTLHNKYGDCKDKVALMRSLLHAIGIPSTFALTNTRQSIHKDLPSPFQFNHAIIAIPWRSLDTNAALPGATSGEWMFFDPTDEVNPFGALPPHLQGNLVLVCDDRDSNLVRLPYSAPADNYRMCRGVARIAKNTSLTAQLTIIDRGALSQYVRHFLKHSTRDEQIASLRAFYAGAYADFDISNYSAGTEDDSVWMSYQLYIGRAVTLSSGSAMLRPHVFPLQDLPVLPKGTRQHPLWFGGPYRLETQMDIYLPEGWKITENIPPRTISCLDVARIEYGSKAFQHYIRLNSLRENSGVIVSENDYESARTFSREAKALSDLLIMIKTNN